MTPRTRSWTLAGLVLAALSGCEVGPDYQPPQTPTPPSFAAPSSDQTAVDLASWWRALGDAQVNALVEQAVSANPDIEVALTRLQQARLQEAVVLGTALPQAEASAGGGRGTGSDLSRSRVSTPLGSADNTGRMKVIEQVAGFDASWELDLFGRLRRSMEAARDDRDAAAEARNQVLISVIADVVRAYVDLRGGQTSLAVLRANIAVAAKSRDFVKLRYERGLTNGLDLTLAERELATLRADEAVLAAKIDAARYAIAVLIGRFPEDMGDALDKPTAMPALPERINAGLPLDLLKRRPDIRQAERQLAAATARVGVATASLFPRVSLTGDIGVQSPGLGTGSAAHIWSLGPSAYWPLLDFGTLDAVIDIADLQTHQQLVTYKSTIVSAVRDVDIAVTGFNSQQDRVKNLGDALLQSQQAVILATKRYNRGLTDYLNVVDAERQKFAIEAQYVSAQQIAAENFVAVFRNLGGGWEHYQALPPLRHPHPAVMAMFERLWTPSHADEPLAP